MEVDSTELSNFVKGVLKGLQDGVAASGSSITDPIKFELAVVTTKEKEGKFRLMLAEAGGKYQKEEISKITFTVF